MKQSFRFTQFFIKLGQQHEYENKLSKLLQRPTSQRESKKLHTVTGRDP